MLRKQTLCSTDADAPLSTAAYEQLHALIGKTAKDRVLNKFGVFYFLVRVNSRTLSSCAL